MGDGVIRLGHAAGWRTQDHLELTLTPAQFAAAVAYGPEARAVRAGPDPYAWSQTGPVPLTRAMAPLLRGGGGEGAREGAAAVRVLAYADYLARIAPTLPLPHKALGAYWR